MALELVTLAQAKAHLRVMHSHEDSDIQLKLKAATRMALAYLDRDVYATQQDLDDAVAAGTARTCPLLATDDDMEMVRAGILLLLGDLYANREEVVTGTITSQLQTGAKACLRLIRRMGA
ncbi:head-tail connector protein [Comamonas sp.]|uniref:head-tail connector protein n=1 Tax=Comamonas sp. TaxID=34028 RepID=UPI003A8FBA06